MIIFIFEMKELINFYIWSFQNESNKYKLDPIKLWWEYSKPNFLKVEEIWRTKPKEEEIGETIEESLFETHLKQWRYTEKQTNLVAPMLIWHYVLEHLDKTLCSWNHP